MSLFIRVCSVQGILVGGNWEVGSLIFIRKFDISYWKPKIVDKLMSVSGGNI